MIDFYKNKKVVITGGAGGLGREMIKLLLSFESKITAIVSPNSDIDGIECDIIRCDLGDISEVNGLLWDETFDNVDILINCAGVFLIKTLEETTQDDFDYSMNVNVKSPFIITKRCLKSMKEDGGLIINVGSSSSYNGSPTSGLYCISKHALLGLNRSLHKEFKKYNIRSLMFSPGSIKTKMGKTDTSQDFNTFLDPKEVAEYILFSSKYNNEMFIEESRMNRISVV